MEVLVDHLPDGMSAAELEHLVGREFGTAHDVEFTAGRRSAFVRFRDAEAARRAMSVGEIRVDGGSRLLYIYSASDYAHLRGGERGGDSAGGTAAAAGGSGSAFAPSPRRSRSRSPEHRRYGDRRVSDSPSYSPPRSPPRSETARPSQFRGGPSAAFYEAARGGSRAGNDGGWERDSRTNGRASFDGRGGYAYEERGAPRGFERDYPPRDFAPGRGDSYGRDGYGSGAGSVGGGRGGGFDSFRDRGGPRRSPSPAWRSRSRSRSRSRGGSRSPPRAGFDDVPRGRSRSPPPWSGSGPRYEVRGRSPPSGGQYGGRGRSRSPLRFGRSRSPVVIRGRSPPGRRRDDFGGRMGGGNPRHPKKEPWQGVKYRLVFDGFPRTVDWREIKDLARSVGTDPEFAKATGSEGMVEFRTTEERDKCKDALDGQPFRGGAVLRCIVDERVEPGRGKNRRFQRGNNQHQAQQQRRAPQSPQSPAQGDAGNQGEERD